MILSVIFCVLMLSMTACFNSGKNDTTENNLYDTVIKEVADTLMIHNDSTGKDEMKIVTIMDTMVVKKDK